MTQKTIIITGASSGIGAALALEYAKTNCKLFLFGRSSERLAKVAKDCETLGAKVEIITGDLCDLESTEKTMTAILVKNTIDIIIACAGVSAGTLGGLENLAQVTQIFATNINGSINVVVPTIPQMIHNKAGKIVLISSMAGMLGLSSAPTYSASKVAIKFFGDALRAYLKQFNIQVSVVIPGYVDTPMTMVNKFPMPFKISAEKAANIIIKGIKCGEGIIVFPKFTYYMLKLISLLPYRLIDYINAKLPGKPSF